MVWNKTTEAIADMRISRGDFGGFPDALKVAVILTKAGGIAFLALAGITTVGELQALFGVTR